MNEGVVPGGQNVAYCKDIARGILRAESSFLLGLNCLLSGSFLDFGSFFFCILGRSFSDDRCCFCLLFLNLSHNIN